MGKIKTVSVHYSECDFEGNLNQHYDPLFSAQDAIEAIVEIVKETENAH